MKKGLLLLLACGFLTAFVLPPTSYYSITDGVFEAFIWSTTSHEGGNCICAAGCTVGNNENVYIAHDLTSACSPLDIEGGGELVIRDGGSLTLPLDAAITGNGDITIEEGGLLIVPGDLDISGNGNMTVDGDLSVGGDIITSGSGTICGDGTITLTGSTSGSGVCGTITINTPAGLPIELISFTATPASGKVQLDWVTGSEDDNEYFTIERSSNGLTFVPILEVPGAINSTAALSYQAFDNKPLDGTAYYRLRQTDTDGVNEVSELIAVQMDLGGMANGDCVFQVNPNPCQGNCTVVLSDCPENATQDIVVDVIDAAGNRVSSKMPVRTNEGSFDFDIDQNNNLKPGVYFVVGTSATESYTQKVIMR